ncbi:MULTISPECIES: 2-hydroxyacid dehydrogenase [unclassified Acidiplasma]|uniref:2-hydroxyacid dehydrogenase n=1 Tax=unclassified Acidiplasma TaxID=2641301 RepID=UPI0006991C8F|nr:MULTISPECIES: 2-hydroxyacid dehydrogenase [unclassified Acidiplasma]WMT54970.1 MAG: 2-hydroxyacid dehydrogenase [Acidiplasma sp.]
MKISVQVNTPILGNSIKEKMNEICRKITGCETVSGYSDDADIVLFIGQPKPSKKTVFMQSLSAGVNHVDFSLIPENIKMASNADAWSVPVSEHVMALLLAFTRKICQSNTELHNGIYKRLDDKSYIVLNGKTLGILGYGGIGRHVAGLANAFGMKIIAYTRTYKPDDISEFKMPDELMKLSDFVLISLPLNKYTRNFVDKSLLSKFNGYAIINVGRAEIVNHSDMIDFLNNSSAYYLTDVWWDEPKINEKIPDNVIITPHIGGMSDNIEQQFIYACKNIKNFLNGSPKNIVRRDDYI